MLLPRSSRLWSACLCALAAVALAACEDPSGVGLSVLDLEDEDPRAQTVLPDAVRFGDFDDLTGLARTNTSDAFTEARVLVGAVEDPLLGPLTARGFIDFFPPAEVPEGFPNRELDEVRLRLVPDYVYGDTTAATSFDVYEVSEDWPVTGVAADTTFGVEDAVIGTVSVAATDTVVVFNLDEAWVAERDTLLRSSSVASRFHGFELRPQEGAAGAVYGFSEASRLELISADDTVRFAASKVFTNLEAEPAEPEHERLTFLQDGNGRALEIDFDFDALETLALNTGLIRIPVDTTAIDTDLPAGFVRPLARELALVAVDDEGGQAFIGSVELDPEHGWYEFASSGLTALIQDALLGQVEVDHFSLTFPAAPTTLDVAPLLRFRASDPDRENPRAVLYAVPPVD